MVRKQNNSRSLIKKNKQDGGVGPLEALTPRAFARMCFGNRANVSSKVLPQQNVQIDEGLKMLLQREQERNFIRTKKTKFGSFPSIFGRSVQNIYVYNEQPSQQTSDVQGFIDLTPLMTKISYFKDEVYEKYHEQITRQVNEAKKETKNLYWVCISESDSQTHPFNEVGVSYDDPLNNKEIGSMYDDYLLEKLANKKSDYSYTDVFRAEKGINKIYVDRKFNVGNNYIYIVSLNREVTKYKEHIIPELKKVFKSKLDLFLKNTKYKLTSRGKEEPLLIDLLAIKSADDHYLESYLDYLFDKCESLKLSLTSSLKLSELECGNDFIRKNLDYKFDQIYNRLESTVAVKKCKTETETETDNKNLLFIDKGIITRKLHDDSKQYYYEMDKSIMDNIIKLFHHIPKEEEDTSEKKEDREYHYNMVKSIFTKYTYDIFSNLKSFITDNFESTIANDLIVKFDELIKKIKEITTTSSGGNHFIKRINHCNLSIKKEKKPTKKASEKKPTKKAAEKKPTKKAVEKKPVKKPTKKAAEKKPVKKAAEKKPVKKAAEKKPVKKAAEKKP